MRPEKLYLTDIVEAARAIEKFIMGVDFNEFKQNEMMNSAVLQKLTVIGEAASKLTKEFTKRFPEIPWRDIVGFRTIAVHEYFAVRWDIGLPPQKKRQLCVSKSKRFWKRNSPMNKSA
jgi:uncharacterized protein with HEPN domain